MENIAEIFSLFIFFAGFVIGLGAVTVLDILGFKGRNSAYWTQTTIRAHKVTKPLIWTGIFLAVIGGVWFYQGYKLTGIPLTHLILACVLVINGLYLSFVISPYLIKRELDGQDEEILPKAIQRRIIISLVISDICWWSALGLLAYFLSVNL